MQKANSNKQIDNVISNVVYKKEKKVKENYRNKRLYWSFMEFLCCGLIQYDQNDRQLVDSEWIFISIQKKVDWMDITFFSFATIKL